jgi:hypothetical protein
MKPAFFVFANPKPKIVSFEKDDFPERSPSPDSVCSISFSAGLSAGLSAAFWIALSCVFLNFVFSLSVSAFEILPEYRGLQNPKLLDTDFEIDPDLNAEYNSDLLTYWKPLSWRRSFHENKDIFQITYGSLDSKIFYVGNQLKLQKKFTENLDFSFIHFTQKDFENEEENTFFQLSYDLGLADLHFYHSSFHEKKENDRGVAVSLKPASDHSIRLFHTWVDYSRHKRNELKDRFEKGEEPRSFGLVGRWMPKQQKTTFLEYSLRRETPTQWSFPDAEKRYDYEKTLGAVHYTSAIHSKLNLSYRLQWSDKKEELKDTQSLSVPLGVKDFEKVMQSVSGRFKEIRHGDDSLSAGILWTKRKWSLENSETTREGFSPHLIWHSFFEKWKGLDFGYETTLHRENSSSFRSEHRFNLWWNFRPTKDQWLRMIFTADLDEFGSSSTWEGGSVQWQAKF